MTTNPQVNIQIKNLNPQEISDPKQVLADFFSVDDVPGHKKQLKKWRDCVTADGYYVNEKGSPSGLVFEYQLNLKLLEASAILLEKTRWPIVPTSHGNLIIPDTEKHAWPWYPVLEPHELLNPDLILNRIFGDYSLSQYQEMLFDWLSFGLSVQPADEFITPLDLIKVYENLSLLYDALWLIHMRYVSPGDKIPGDNVPGDNTAGYHVSGDLVSGDCAGANSYDLDVCISESDQKLIGGFVAMAKNKVETISTIYYLGKQPLGAGLHFFLVLTTDAEKRETQNLAAMLEECSGPGNLIALVHHANRAFLARQENDRFFNAMLARTPVYISGEHFTSLSSGKPFKRNNPESDTYWFHWQKQGYEFLSGAQYYLSEGAFAAALFSLHQCAECFLIAIIRAVTGYRINNHNLLRLLRITQMFNNDLIGLFELDDENGKQRFDVLKNAYINVRYRDNYEPDTKDIDTLYPVIKKLATMTECIWLLHRKKNILQ